MEHSKSTIDLFLTNKPLDLKKTVTIQTVVNDYHKIITIFCKARSEKLRPKIVFYRNHKKFKESAFLSEFVCGKS